MTMARLTPVDVDTPFRVRLTGFCRAHGIQVHTPSQEDTLSHHARVVRLMRGTVFERMEDLNLRLPENQRIEDALGRVLEYCTVRLLVSGARRITLSKLVAAVMGQSVACSVGVDPCAHRMWDDTFSTLIEEQGPPLFAHGPPTVAQVRALWRECRHRLGLDPVEP